MKKLLLFLLIFPLVSFGQNDSETVKDHYMYAEILGMEKLLSNKVTVQIDFGQETKFFHADKNRIIDPETGKPRVFNSMVDAMNYMGSLGWEFVQAYVVTVSNQNVYHWLMRMKLSDQDAREFIPMIRGDLKKGEN